MQRIGIRVTVILILILRLVHGLVGIRSGASQGQVQKVPDSASQEEKRRSLKQREVAGLYSDPRWNRAVNGHG
jgi:hypothetical protein